MPLLHFPRTEKGNDSSLKPQLLAHVRNSLKVGGKLLGAWDILDSLGDNGVLGPRWSALVLQALAVYKEGLQTLAQIQMPDDFRIAKIW